MKLVFFLSLALTTTLFASGPFDTTRLQAGRFVYRATQHGKVIGTFTLTITPQADGTTIFTGDAEGFHQHWRAATKADFTPLFAELRIRSDSGSSYAMDVRYENYTARGVIAKAPAPDKPTVCSVPADTVDQRLDWAAMLSTRLTVGEELAFHVYDPDSGLTPVLGSFHDVEKISLNLGTYEALRLRYRMAKSEGPESYDILITQDVPRIMLREEFPDGTVTELIEAHPTGI